MSNFFTTICLLTLLLLNIHCQFNLTSYPNVTETHTVYTTDISTVLLPNIINSSGEYYFDVDVTLYEIDMQIECNHPGLCYIECNTYNACQGLNVTALNQLSNVEIQCNGYYSCASMNIHQLTAISVTINCNDDNACQSLVFKTSVVSNMTLYCGRDYPDHEMNRFCAYAELYASDITHLQIECIDIYACYAMNIYQLTTTSFILECTETGACQNMEIYNNTISHADISCSASSPCSSLIFANNAGIDTAISCEGSSSSNYACSTSIWDLTNYNQVYLICNDTSSCDNVDLLCPAHYVDNTCSVTCNNEGSCSGISIYLVDDEFEDYLDLQCSASVDGSSPFYGEACYGGTITCTSMIHNTAVATSISDAQCSNIFCCPWKSVVDELNDIDYCSDDEHCNLMCNLMYDDVLSECGGVVDAFFSLSLMMSCNDAYVCDHTTVICPQYGDCTINCIDGGCGYLLINSTLSHSNTIHLLCTDYSCENIVVLSSQNTSLINILCSDRSCAQSQFHLSDADNVVIYAMGVSVDGDSESDTPYDFEIIRRFDSRRLQDDSITIQTLSNAWIDVTNTRNVDIFASGYSLHNSVIFGNGSCALNIMCPQYSCYDTNIYCPNHLENSCNVICDSCNGTVIHFDQGQTTRNWFHLELYNAFTNVQMECNNNGTTSFSMWEDHVVCNDDICCPLSTYEDVVIGDISIPSWYISRFQVSALVYIKSELAFDPECTDCFEWYIQETNTEIVFVSVNDVYGRTESVTLYNTKIGSYVTGDGRQEYDIFEAHLVIRSVLDANAGYCYQQNQSDIRIIQPGTKYEVRIDIFESDVLDTVYQSDPLSVYTAAPPSGGYCTIMNNDDMQVFSNFSIECWGWESYDSYGLRYNALIQDVPFLDEFAANVTAFRGIVGIGDIQITVLIKDLDSSFTACYAMNVAFPSIEEVLERNDSIADIEDDVVELLQQTQPNHAMISIYSVIDALYEYNEFVTPGFVSQWVNTLIDEIISESSNRTIAIAVERVLSDVTTLKTLTSNPKAIELETVSNIAEGYLDYISESIIEHVTNDTINPDTLYSLVTESQTIIHNLENVMKISTANISNHLSSVLVDKSLLFAHLSLLKSLPGEFYRFISDTVYSQKVISAAKFENLYNSSSNMTHECGYNKQYLQVPSIFNQQNVGIFDCAFVTGSDNFMVNDSDYTPVSNLVSVQIYNNASAIMQETDGCNPYLISINVRNKSVLNNNENSYTLGDESVFPQCNFWSKEWMWSDYGCVVHEFSDDDDTVVCACEHLTTFEVSQEFFKLEANLIAQYDVRNVSVQNLDKYPIVWVTMLIVGVLMVMICLWNPVKNDRSSIAYEDIIFTKVRDERLKNDIAGKEIEIIGKHLPNAHFIGRGLTEMAQDKKGTKSLCLLQCHLFYIYLRNDHTLWSIFQRTSGTNFSTKQRIGCFFMYLSLIMVSTALFYGQKQNSTFGDVSASFIISLCSTVPVFFVKKLFINAKPKLIKRTIHIDIEGEGETEAIKDMDDAYDMDDDGLEYNEYAQTKRMSSTYYKSLNSIKKNKMATKVSTLYTALGEVNKSHSQQHRIILVDEVRKTLYNTIYPLHHKWKLCAWIIVAVITLVCCIVAIIYGLKFDAGYDTVNNPDYSGDITLFDEECWNYNKQLLLEYTLSLQIIEQLKAELESTFIDNYANCSESTRWLINCGVSLLWSWFLWQPLTIFIMTFLKVWMFTWNLKMGLTPKNVMDLMRYCCKQAVPDVDDVEAEIGGNVSEHHGPSYLAISNKNRPLDIIGYLSNDELFLKTNRDDEKHIQLLSPTSNEHQNTDKCTTDDQHNDGKQIEIEMNATNGRMDQKENNDQLTGK